VHYDEHELQILLPRLYYPAGQVFNEVHFPATKACEDVHMQDPFDIEIVNVDAQEVHNPEGVEQAVQFCGQLVQILLPGLY
jgi:hypothetical protein